MSYIGNPPVVQSSRLVYEETAATAKTAFTPPGGYTVGQLEVYINGAQLMSDDFSATDGSTINLTTACAIGDGFKSIAYGNFLTTNALNKTGDTMTGPLTLGGLLNTGATGQIKFPAAQNVSADANTLDDYEEGTWSPTFAYATPGTNPTYTTQLGWYTKIGNIVTCQALVQMSNKGSGSGLTFLGGLPFPTPTTPLYSGISVGYVSGFSSNAPSTCYLDPGQTRGVLFNSVTSNYTDYANLTNTTLLAVQLTYRVA